jgi:D-alanyl-D-alanine carboxypeptidase/D-alanyl-D-alanine-endopeptidase (penicillin-binding protein 4)
MSPLTVFFLLLGSLSLSEQAWLSAPTVPTSPDSAAVSLQSDLHALLRQHRLGADAAVLVVSVARGDTLFSHNPHLSLVPASNLKLLTSLAALHYLGPSFRYNTYLLASGPVRDGILEGDLVLYGTGDPTLSSRFGDSVLGAFADTLSAMGIREIRGDIVGDASYFGGPGVGAGWRSAYSNATYAAPSSALSLSENLASVVIRPASSAGGQPTVRIAPGGRGLDVINSATTAVGRTRLVLGRGDYNAPLTVRGQVSTRSTGVTYTVPVADPPLFAAAALREALEANGLIVRGVTRSVADAEVSTLAARTPFAPAFGRRSQVQVLAIHTSPPLLDILEVVNKQSNNFMAEQVVRTIGRVARGEGTVQGGATAVRDFMVRTLSVDSTSLELFDGSGLSPLNRVTAASVVGVLEFAHAATIWPAFWKTLPETGTPRELRRMLRTPAEGRVRAKTGTLRGVSAFSGYVMTAGGERLAFSIINNAASNSWRAKLAEDAVVIRLAVFERAAVGVNQPVPPGSPPTSR